MSVPCESHSPHVLSQYYKNLSTHTFNMPFFTCSQDRSYCSMCWDPSVGRPVTISILALILLAAIYPSWLVRKDQIIKSAKNVLYSLYDFLPGFQHHRPLIRLSQRNKINFHSFYQFTKHRFTWFNFWNFRTKRALYLKPYWLTAFVEEFIPLTYSPFQKYWNNTANSFVCAVEILQLAWIIMKKKWK